jgi:hypothetical protein
MRRTIDAIQVDITSSPDWKRKVITHLHEAMRLFLEHDTRAQVNSHDHALEGRPRRE